MPTRTIWKQDGMSAISLQAYFKTKKSIPKLSSKAPKKMCIVLLIFNLFAFFQIYTSNIKKYHLAKSVFNFFGQFFFKLTVFINALEHFPTFQQKVNFYIDNVLLIKV